MSLKIYSSGINFKLVSNSVAADKESKVNSSKSENNYKSVGLTSRYNDHLLAFKARVDKGLERFYNANKDRMPVTVRRYVENLEDKTRLTPLEAQRRAFEKLQVAQTVEDIKKAYSDDKLFEKIIQIKPDEHKCDYITPSEDALFLDDSFNERREIMEKFGIKAVGVDMIEVFLNGVIM